MLTVTFVEYVPFLIRFALLFTWSSFINLERRISFPSTEYRDDVFLEKFQFFVFTFHILDETRLGCWKGCRSGRPTQESAN